MKKILIIGGGASGMMAAIFAKQKDTDVCIYEKNDRIGKKILATGNGKCNLTNYHFGIEQYYTKEKEQLAAYFSQFSVQDTLSFFQNCGLLLREKDGYVYPYCEQASVVLDVLRSKIKQLKIRVELEVAQLSIQVKKQQFFVHSTKGTEIFDRIILATGSMASKKQTDFSGYDLAKQFSHTIVPLVPALVQVRCQEAFFPSIAGVRAKCKIRLFHKKNLLAEEQGELQLTNYGVSGIPIFQMSRVVAYALKEGKKLSISIDFLPEYSMEKWNTMACQRLQNYQDETIMDCFTGTIHKKILSLLCKQHGLKETEKVSKGKEAELLAIFLEMKNFIVTPVMVNPFENAQVCAGGIPLSEVDSSLQSLYQKGLYFCGEILDVDGKCGGYNLQWAWTSGSIAGKEASK